jgi:hypothetical protein
MTLCFSTKKKERICHLFDLLVLDHQFIQYSGEDFETQSDLFQEL